MSLTSEHALGVAVLHVAANAPTGIATFKRCYAEIPSLIKLKSGDLAPSLTRNGEAMWKQRVRNIKSHHESEDNLISQGLLQHVKGVGYRITDVGRAYLKKHGG